MSTSRGFPSTRGRVKSNNHITVRKSPIRRRLGGYRVAFDPAKVRKSSALHAWSIRASTTLIVLDALRELFDRTNSEPRTVKALLRSGIPAELVRLLAGQVHDGPIYAPALRLIDLVGHMDRNLASAMRLLARTPPTDNMWRVSHRRQLAAARRLLAK